MVSVILFYLLLTIFVKFILFFCLFIAFYCTCPLCFWAASIYEKMGGISRDQNDVSVFMSYLNFQINDPVFIILCWNVTAMRLPRRHHTFNT